MTIPPETFPEDPSTAPNWSFSPDHDVRCPECDTHLSGLNWIIDTEAQLTTGMKLVPCGHELPTSLWGLDFNGRRTGGERRYGTTVRKAAFVRKGE